MKKKAEEKVKFKSVAQAIRAGIMVDRYVLNIFIKQLSPTSFLKPGHKPQKLIF